MNRNTFLIRHASFRPLAALMLLAAVAAPAYVAAADMAKTEPSSTATKMDERVEARIKELHAKLKITPEQEDKWKDVTDVMHENADKVRPLIEARKSKEASFTAVDDLKSYAEILDAHADGVKKFAKTFSPLYDAMSDAQKKTADELFRKHGPGGEHKRHTKGKAAPAAEATP
ncbi:MAG: hypothetical protein JWR16_2560 [Nevskia sp.]|nr:hypothetical protein [Nevskia sp.]